MILWLIRAGTKVRNPSPQGKIVPVTRPVQSSPINARLFFRMASRARTDWSFGVSLFLVAERFVAFDATGFDLCVCAAGNAVVGLFDVDASTFAISIRVTDFLMTGHAFQHNFHARILVRVVTILAACRIRRFDVSSVIKIFDHAPFVMLPPMRTLFRIAKPDDARRRRFRGSTRRRRRRR